ncbi:MAG: riboflavin biosynthesis protein RibF [Planctomycetes bacterium]|jgi:riboflavin kinase/FMN adenylyltransferase|nr:riboflavin biosynthesis protein RibF [Planctomycetota bacterium]MCP4839666.1 riboflavin biosynthesis protein RibF [Planctomycetota bacterium]
MGTTAVIIGNFDGVHLGHAALVGAARKAAGAKGRVVVLTFDPPPVQLLQPGISLRRLMLPERRVITLGELGVDDVVMQPIDRDWLMQSPEAFIRSCVAPLNPDVVVEGHDFRFGLNRSGGITELTAFGDAIGFKVELVDEVSATLADQTKVVVRSSMIRELLAQGRIGDAARLLGRHWCLEGRVVPGDARGREIGCPTANLDHGDLLLPTDGVYAGVATCPAGTYPAAVSIGTKPSFGQTPRVAEVHLIGWDGPVGEYDWWLRVDMDRWIRDQARFDSLDTLKAQIARDIEEVLRGKPASTP